MAAMGRVWWKWGGAGQWVGECLKRDVATDTIYFLSRNEYHLFFFFFKHSPLGMQIHVIIMDTFKCVTEVTKPRLILRY